MQSHSLNPSFVTFSAELNTLFSSVDLPATVCAIVTADVWGHEYVLSSGEMTFHRLEDTRLPKIPDNIYDGLIGRVMAMAEQDYLSQVPLNIKDITVKVRTINATCMPILPNSHFFLINLKHQFE